MVVRGPILLLVNTCLFFILLLLAGPLLIFWTQLLGISHWFFRFLPDWLILWFFGGLPSFLAQDLWMFGLFFSLYFSQSLLVFFLFPQKFLLCLDPLLNVFDLIDLGLAVSTQSRQWPVVIKLGLFSPVLIVLLLGYSLQVWVETEPVFLYFQLGLQLQEPIELEGMGHVEFIVSKYSVPVHFGVTVHIHLFIILFAPILSALLPLGIALCHFVIHAIKIIITSC